MRSIVRKDTGEDYKDVPQAAAGRGGGREPDRRGRCAASTRTRKKKVSNEEWESPSDPDSRIAKMKDGRTHLAYKAEHVVDLDSGVRAGGGGAPGRPASDPATLVDSVLEAQVNLEAGGQRAGDRGGGGGQGLPQGRDAGGLRGVATRGPTFRSRRAGSTSGTDKPEADAGR